MSDFINVLPTNDRPVDPAEMELFDAVVAPKGSLYHILQDLRSTIVASLIFFVLSLDFVDTLIQSTISYAKSSKTALVIVKTAIFFLVLFIFNNRRMV